MQWHSFTWIGTDMFLKRPLVCSTSLSVLGIIMSWLQTYIIRWRQLRIFQKIKVIFRGKKKEICFKNRDTTALIQSHPSTKAAPLCSTHSHFTLQNLKTLFEAHNVIIWALNTKCLCTRDREKVILKPIVTRTRGCLNTLLNWTEAETPLVDSC